MAEEPKLDCGNSCIRPLTKEMGLLLVLHIIVNKYKISMEWQLPGETAGLLKKSLSQCLFNR
jgi:hypothetical protein